MTDRTHVPAILSVSVKCYNLSPTKHGIDPVWYRTPIDSVASTFIGQNNRRNIRELFDLKGLVISFTRN
jgi:hypothetical protein